MLGLGLLVLGLHVQRVVGVLPLQAGVGHAIAHARMWHTPVPILAHGHVPHA